MSVCFEESRDLGSRYDPANYEQTADSTSFSHLTAQLDLTSSQRKLHLH
jgi:hypothetical protein